MSSQLRYAVVPRGAAGAHVVEKVDGGSSIVEAESRRVASASFLYA